MSIILTMFALLMASLLGDASQKRQEKTYVSTQARMEKIAESLQFYAQFHDYLPCPASRELPLSSANFGRSSTKCQTPSATPDGTQFISNANGNNDQYQLIVGMVPVRELGLKDDDAFDTWKRRITYIMIRPTGIYPNGYRSYSPWQMNDYPILRNAQNTDVVGTSPSNLPAFILISHGIDGKGAFTQAGTLFRACGASYDSENCNNDKLLRLSPLVTNIAETHANYYHDIILWRPIVR
ncbi:MAG: hypothetical protein EAZ74_05090 [Alphaproteobacteria bacterium]|nr:MAG: hypothetical protein EAZ74_05090 [Alphaproteobacteria bacterium]TAF41864.1 MAG: hypothetical protein EAZ66_00590 [Alphaproteobacteria bacterium]TAF77229.1 MAG: hypothetical protein EAZ52_01465 [Alphaproteobacteria bacterium]